jgi:pyrimidine operon attenuation protein/uracil phosphoribosyltransferase
MTATLQEAVIEAVFPPQPELYYSPSPDTISGLARPLIEHVHATQPDAIIGADRGGRLLSLALHHGWHYRYPDEQFPTRNGSIQFTRISKRLFFEEIEPAIHDAFTRAGLDPAQNEADKEAKVLLVDDWVYRGTTFRMFAQAAVSFGLREKNLSLATMNDNKLENVNHIVCDPRSSGSAWDGDESTLGFFYRSEYMDGGRYSYKAIPMGSPRSRNARRRLHERTRAYYSDFTAAVAAGIINPAEYKEEIRHKEAETE